MNNSWFRQHNQAKGQNAQDGEPCSESGKRRTKHERPFLFESAQLYADPFRNTMSWFHFGAVLVNTKQCLLICRAPAKAGLKKGDLVLIASVGAGFTVEATLFRWAY